MPDTKISNLTAYTTPISTDVLAIVDTTNGITKKITYGDLNSEVGTNLLENSNFINNSTSGYGSATPDGWTSSSSNGVQGGFPSMTKAELISLLGINDGDIEGLWNLNEASGNATDLSSNGYTLNDNNTVTSSDDGLMGKARSFVKANSEYLSIAATSCTNLEIAANQTWFCWQRPDATPINGVRIMGKSDATPTNFSNVSQNASSYNFNLSGFSSMGSDVVPQQGKWHFIVCVLDTTNSKMKIWVNGVKKESTLTGSKVATGGDFTIGRLGSSTGDYYGTQSIQNAGVLSVALTDTQVMSLWAETSYCKQKIRRATTNASLTATLKQDKVMRLRGKTVTMSAKMWQEVASTGTLTVNDGTADTSATTATTGSWVDVSVTSTISATATSITLGLNNAVSDGNVWFKEVMLNVGSTALPWTPAPEDWARFPRLLRMDIPAVVNGYSFEEGRWYNWTPSYSAAGSMTFTSVSTTKAIYSVGGKSVMWVIYANGTTGGTASAAINFTLPAIFKNQGYSENQFYGSVDDGGAAAGICFSTASVNTANVLKYNSANFALAAGKYLRLGGTYEID
jgi:hypothetical protein